MEKSARGAAALVLNEVEAIDLDSFEDLTYVTSRGTRLIMQQGVEALDSVSEDVQCPSSLGRTRISVPVKFTDTERPHELSDGV
jgi:hypothetical protein